MEIVLLYLFLTKEVLEVLKATLVSVVFLVLLLSVCALAMGQAENFLVGYWPFDDGSGKEAKDASGNGNDGELIGDPKWVEGKYERALEFAGGSYVNVPDDPSLELIDTATVMCWFKLTDALTGTSRIMSKNDSIFIIFDFGDPNTLDFLIKPNNDFVDLR